MYVSIGISLKRKFSQRSFRDAVVMVTVQGDSKAPDHPHSQLLRIEMF